MIDTTARPEAHRRNGLAHPLHPTVLGSIIGGAGGTAFVLNNRGALPDSWPTITLVAWVVVAAVAIWTVMLQPRELADPPPPAEHAGAVYGMCIGGMFAGFALGRVLLDAAGHVELLPAVIVLVVGLHFVPFATAFRAPVFGRLGWSVVALGALGLAWGWASGEVAARSVAVAAGLVMLAFIAWSAWTDRRVEP